MNVRIKNKCVKLLKTLNIKYKFNKISRKNYKNYSMGRAFLRENTIEVFYSKNTTGSRFASLVYHEIEHILCHRNYKYPVYHQCILPENTIKWYNAFIRTGLRAERYVDNAAYKRFRKDFGSSMKFTWGYKSSWGINWYNENYMKIMKERRDKLKKYLLSI